MASDTTPSRARTIKRVLLIALFLVIALGLIAAVVVSAIYLPPTLMTIPLMLSTIANLPAVLLTTLVVSIGVANLTSALYRLFWNAFPEWPTHRFYRHLIKGREGTRGDRVGWIGYLTNLSFISRSKYGEHDQNPLMVALEHGHGADTISLMCVKRRKLVTEQDTDGWTPLMYAAYYNYPGAVKILANYFEASEHMRVKSNIGETALIFAVKYRKMSFISELLRECVEIGINESDFDGNTALMHAVMNYDVKLVSILLNTQKIDGCRAAPMEVANLHLRNHEKKTAFDLAKEQATKELQAAALYMLHSPKEAADHAEKRSAIHSILSLLEAAEKATPRPLEQAGILAGLNQYNPIRVLRSPSPLIKFSEAPLEPHHSRESSHSTEAPSTDESNHSGDSLAHSEIHPLLSPSRSASLLNT